MSKKNRVRDIQDLHRWKSALERDSSKRKLAEQLALMTPDQIAETFRSAKTNSRPVLKRAPTPSASPPDTNKQVRVTFLQSVERSKHGHNLTIWTDGACLGNGRTDAVGSWAFVCSDGHEAFARVEDTTNNRTELMAVIEAMRYATSKGHRSVKIFSDSQLTIFCATGKWRRHKNLDLWADFEAAKINCTPSFSWVRGHNGDAGNERADQLCRVAMEVDYDVEGAFDYWHAYSEGTLDALARFK